MFAARQTAWLGTASKALAFSIILVLAGCGERISRDDFDAAVKGQSTSEVATRFGDPDAVDDSAASTVRWTYNSKTFRIDGGTKLDKRTIVVFRKMDPNVPAKVVEVLYE